MKTKICACIAFSIMLIVACSKSSEDSLTDPDPNPGGGNNNCDTTTMSYQNDIVPILSANCYSCHGENSNSNSMGIILEGHSNLQPRAISGTLVGVITHASGFPAMPQNAGKLSECNINKIKAWVDAGALDN
jgi:cytochrome c553